MIRDISRDQPGRTLEKDELKLPSFQGDLASAMKSGKSLPVDGTNVIRVPFGIRKPHKQRPDRPERWVTLVLPFHPEGSPTPPPQAA